MAALTWDVDSERFYETGISNVALYPYDKEEGSYGKGVAWNGVTSLNESPSGAEETALYADNIKYLSLRSLEELGATIEAYTYPDEWRECDGSVALVDGVYIGQQARKSFCLVYKTKVGNDTQLDDYGYQLHILYNCVASPSERPYSTINDSPEAITFSWEIKTNPVAVAGYKNTALVTIHSKKVKDPTKLTALEAILYGTEEDEPRIVMPTEILTMFSEQAAG